MTLSADYMAAAETLLSLEAPMRAGAANAKRGAAIQARARAFLPQSRNAGRALHQNWQRSKTAAGRSLIEVQLLTATAIDLAVMEKLLGAASPVTRSVSAATNAALLQGLRQPQTLLRPTIQLAHYRGADHALLAAVHQVVGSIEENTIETTADAIASAILMNAAILKEAGKLVSIDMQQWLQDVRARELMRFLIEAWRKLRILVGAESLATVQNVALEATQKLHEKVTVSHYVNNFLNTDAIYRNTRLLLSQYQGPDDSLSRLRRQIHNLQGSFSSRTKLVATIVRLLALLRLAPPLNQSPWAQVGIGSAYLLAIGYELYTAHDHVDSNRYPFFDRVQGVHTLVKQTLTPGNNTSHQ